MCGRLVCSTHTSKVTLHLVPLSRSYYCCCAMFATLLANSILLYSVGVYLKLLHSNVEQLDTPVSPTEGHQGTTDTPIVQCFPTRRKHSLLRMKVQRYFAGWHRGNCNNHHSCSLLKLLLQKSRCGFRDFHLSPIGHRHSSLLLSEIEY